MSDAPRTNTRQFCARCQNIDRVGFTAPKDLWRLVAGPRWEHDILCLSCFAEIGDEKGVKWDVPELEFWPVSYVTLASHRSSGIHGNREHLDYEAALSDLRELVPDAHLSDAIRIVDAAQIDESGEEQ